MKDIFPDHVETSKEEKPTIREKLLIKAYDFCQSRRRVETLLTIILGSIIYAMWKFIT